MRWRGFGISVELPDRAGRAFRKLVGRPDATSDARLVVRKPPRVKTEPRDDRAWNAFLGGLQGSKCAPAPEDLDTHDKLADEVAARTWYHTLELPFQIVTPGAYDHRQLVPHYGLPDDLDGQSALDVASADGFWALELERRGADVTSADVRTLAELDLPGVARTFISERDAIALPFESNFALVRRVLGSKIQIVHSNVYDLDPKTTGTFDLVHTGDLLHHLRDPVLALERLRSVCHGRLLFSDVFDPAIDTGGGGPGLTRHLRGSAVLWWAPALGTLTQMVSDAGFLDVEVVTTYSLAERGATQGPWRAVLRARV